MMRVDKFLSRMQIASRSEAKQLLKDGRLSLNGVTVKDGSTKCDPEKDVILVDGKSVSYTEFRYVMLHKPAGCVTATRDARERTVMEYLPADMQKGMSPVGRLDKDTEGLLLITDDGALNHALLAPKSHVEKTYFARIAGCVTQEEVRRFRDGLIIGEKRPTAPAKLRILRASAESEVLVSITEGKFHQIKRMFQAVGMEVVYLKRLSMGTLVLDDSLAPGEWRELTAEETAALKESRL